MLITKNNFWKIFLITTIFLVPAIFLTLTKWGNKGLALIIIILSLGLIWFVIDVIRYIKNKTYTSNKLNIKNIGGLMGLGWFIAIEISLLIFLIINFDGICTPFEMFNSHLSRPCSLLTFLFSGVDFISTVLFFISSWFLFLPITMYIFGFFMDKYIAKKIKATKI